MRIFILCMFFSSSLFAQQFMCKDGEIRFFSDAPIEDIQAINQQAMAVIDLQSGGFAFKVNIKDFVFPNSLMQEHFNESYLESDQFPHSTFTGLIENFGDVSQKNTIEVSGELVIHGISQKTKLQATIQEIGNSLHITSVFDVVLNDYDIDIPKIMMYKIAEVIEVSVDMKLQKRSNE